MSREPRCPIANMVCPRNNDPAKGKYCPAWTEYMESNPQTGEERLQKECVFTAMPKFLIHTLQAANRPAAAVESMRNEMVDGLRMLTQATESIPRLVQQRGNGHDPHDG